MRWPWSRHSSGTRLIVSWADGVLSYVVANPGAEGRFQIKSAGVERRGADSLDHFASRLAALGLKGLPAVAMLRPAQYQFLQIDAPKVPPQEMRAAARYMVKDMISAHIDDVTLDVLKVGDGKHKADEHLFVVATTNPLVRELLDLSDLMKWDVRVIDVQETAQRNLQQLLAKKEQRQDKADALLTIADDRQGLLTISANDELFFYPPPGSAAGLPDDALGPGCRPESGWSGAGFCAGDRVCAGIRGGWRVLRCGLLSGLGGLLSGQRATPAGVGRAAAFAGLVGPNLVEFAHARGSGRRRCPLPRVGAVAHTRYGAKRASHGLEWRLCWLGGGTRR